MPYRKSHLTPQKIFSLPYRQSHLTSQEVFSFPYKQIHLTPRISSRCPADKVTLLPRISSRCPANKFTLLPRISSPYPANKFTLYLWTLFYQIVMQISTFSQRFHITEKADAPKGLHLLLKLQHYLNSVVGMASISSNAWFSPPIAQMKV